MWFDKQLSVAEYTLQWSDLDATILIRLVVGDYHFGSFRDDAKISVINVLCDFVELVLGVLN